MLELFIGKGRMLSYDCIPNQIYNNDNYDKIAWFHYRKIAYDLIQNEK